MSAAAVHVRVPLYEEGLNFWQKVVEECGRYVQAINQVAASAGICADNFVELLPGSDIHMGKRGYPSTDVNAVLSFFSWGPVIQCTITGARDQNHKFLPEEFEIPIARDLDGETVGIFDEGRSFCPHEVACYLTQAFRRCFHSVSLPCA
jgi:maltoporin